MASPPWTKQLGPQIRPIKTRPTSRNIRFSSTSVICSIKYAFRLHCVCIVFAKCMHLVCISIDPRFSNAQESTLLVEGGRWEWDKAAVSAGEAGRLHCANHLHPGEATSQVHSRGDHGTIPAALRGSKRELFRAARHWQQALLHQPVGHVLTHRSPQEASDRLSRVCTKSAKSASGTLDAHFVLRSMKMNAYFVQT
jgi:hypothetical protein